jgi:hypothetical protein
MMSISTDLLWRVYYDEQTLTFLDYRLIMHKEGSVQRNESKLVRIKGLRQCSSQEYEEHYP